MSALTLMAANEHKHFQIRKGDTIVLSSKMIPGNERAIARIINHLFKHAPRSSTRRSRRSTCPATLQGGAEAHADLVRPTYFIPVHGEYRPSCTTPSWREVGIPEERIFILEDGAVMEFSDGAASRAGQVPAGRVLIDGKCPGRRVRGAAGPDEARPRRRGHRHPRHRAATGRVVSGRTSCPAGSSSRTRRRSCLPR